MNEQMRTLHALLLAVQKDPLDLKTRAVLADFYDDHDEPELAAEQRNFSIAKYQAEQYLQKFADRYAHGNVEGMLEGLVKGEYCFSDDDGPYAARSDKELWEAVRVYTNKGFSNDHFEEGRFRCAC